MLVKNKVSNNSYCNNNNELVLSRVQDNISLICLSIQCQCQLEASHKIGNKSEFDTFKYPCQNIFQYLFSINNGNTECLANIYRFLEFTFN